MKKCILLLLVVLLTMGTFGCTRSVEKKEIPDELADANSVLEYLKQQNEIYV